MYIIDFLQFLRITFSLPWFLRCQRNLLSKLIFSNMSLWDPKLMEHQNTQLSFSYIYVATIFSHKIPRSFISKRSQKNHLNIPEFFVEKMVFSVWRRNLDSPTFPKSDFNVDISNFNLFSKELMVLFLPSSPESKTSHFWRWTWLKYFLFSCKPQVPGCLPKKTLWS